jgi:gliding motility-associated-like protein
VNAGADRSICSADFTQIGVPPLAGFGYSWASNPGLTFTNISNPQFSAITAAPKKDTLILTMTNVLTQCRRNDSVVVTTNPRPLPLNFVPFSNVVCPFTPNVNYAVLNSPAGNTYNWTVSGGTQVSGGNGAAISVNWNGPNPNAKIVVLPTNEFGCVGKKDSLQLVVNQNLKPSKPLGDSVICSDFRAQKLYSTIPTAGSTYTWNSLGTSLPSQTSTTGNVTVDWTITNGIGSIWIEQQSSTVDPITGTPIQCFGRSDTLRVIINRSPDSTLAMSGDVSVCAGPGATRPYALAGYDNSAYNWTISPTAGIVSGQGTGNITVLWADTGNFTVSVVETTNKGCVGKAISKLVRGNPIPRPGLSGLSDSTICPNDLSKPFFAQSAPGFANSSFNWTISGGTPNTATNQIFLAVTWNSVGPYSLSLKETTTAGCTNDFLVPLIYDPSEPVLSHVSLLENDESRVILKFNMKDGALNQSAFSIQRKDLGSSNSTWQTIQSNLALTENQYIDQPGNTAAKANEYRVMAKNRCNKGIESKVLNTILLKAEPLPEKDGINLKWNPMLNWPGGTAGYSILRKVDDESSLSFFDDAPSSSNPERYYEAAGDGFNQCWRVVANQGGGGEKSYSNTVCVKFDNPLVFYNFISPNGDGKNDSWLIKNLKLYPKNQLKIVDRWGRVVFEKNDYSEDNLWDGKDVSEGVYFFQFRVPDKGLERNGWITLKK